VLETYSVDQVAAPDADRRGPPKARTAATITGIGIFPDEVLPDDGDRTARVLLTPAFTRAQQRWTTYGVQQLVLRDGDRDVEAMREHIARVKGAGNVEIRVTSVDAFHAHQAMRPLSIALAVFGLIVGVAGLVLVVQALARVLRAEHHERTVLRALGVPPRAAVCVAMVGPLVAIVFGVALSVAVAFALSPIMPIGPMRRVETAPGLAGDTTVLAAGALVVFAVLVVASVARVRHWAGSPARGFAARRGRLADMAARSGLGAPVVAGLRFATESTPGASSRSVTTGGMIAIAALVGALTFGASLDALVRTPRLFGWSGDAALLAANGYGNIPLDRATAVLDADASIAGWSGAYFGFGTIDGRRGVPLLGMEPGAAVAPPIIRGHPLGGADDIVLGIQTADRLHADVGDSVVFAGSGAPRRLNVVGIATFPSIGRTQTSHASLGVGALVATHLVPGFDRNMTGGVEPGAGPHVVFVRFHHGVDRDAALLHLRSTTKPLAGFAGLDVLPVQRPAEIVNTGAIGTAPTVMAAALAAGAALSLGLALLASVRRHRRDLALLKTLGFTRRQLAATTAWHATVTTAVAVAVGVPFGIVAGRLLWSAFARQLDVAARPTVPLVAVVVVAAGAVLLANVIAAAPGRAARRVKVAALLRSE